jgi:hypothetical protein
MVHHLHVRESGTSEQNLLDALRDPEFKDFQYFSAARRHGGLWPTATHVPSSVRLCATHSYAGLASNLMMNYARRGYTPLVDYRRGGLNMRH